MFNAVRGGFPARRRTAERERLRRGMRPRLDRLEDRTLLAVFAVTSTADSGAGSLRDAIKQANALAGADAVTLAGMAGSISLTSEELLITDDLAITGPGADALSVSGGGARRVFHIDGGVDVEISDLRITRGFASDRGGGILSEGGDLTLDGVVVERNSARSSGGVAQGGGIAVIGAALTMVDSIVTLNSAQGGAAPAKSGGSGLKAQGGGIYVGFGGSLSIGNSTVSSNSAAGGAGGSGFAGSGGGGGGEAAGGGVFLDTATTGDIAGGVFTSNTVTGGAGGAGDGSGAGGPGGAATGGSIASFALDLGIGPDFTSQTLPRFEFNTAAGGAGGLSETGGAGGRGAGGAIYIGSFNGVGATATVDNTSFLTNRATGGKGGSGQVGADGGTGEGGAVYAALNADLDLGNSPFTDNTATGGRGGSGKDLVSSGRGGAGSGGAIASTGGMTAFLSIFAGDFLRNKATGGGSQTGHGGPGSGGAVFLAMGGTSQPPLSVLSTQFKLNQAIGGSAGTEAKAEAGAAMGGALVTAGPASLSSSPFLDNTAQGGAGSTSGLGRGGDASGGAIFGMGPGLSLTACDVLRNRALGGNGLLGAQTDSDKVGAEGGDAFGGGIAVVEGASLDYQGGTIDRNTVRGGPAGFNAKSKAPEGAGRGGDASGGGLYTRGALVQLDLGSDVGLRSNAAEGGDAGTGETGSAYGGALCAVDSSVSVAGGLIFANHATGGNTNVNLGGSAYGGGVYAVGAATTLDIDGAIIFQNLAIGGTAMSIAVFGPATGGSATGGGLCIQNIGGGNIHDTVIYRNEALGSYGLHAGGFALGGGLAVFLSDVTLEDCIVSTNSAHGSLNDPEEDPNPGFGYGGGIYADASVVTLDDTDVEDNDATTDGDDLYGDEFGP